MAFARNALVLVAIVAGVVVLAARTVAEAPASVITFPHRLKIVAFGASPTREGSAFSAPLEAQLRKAMPRGTQVEVVDRGVDGANMGGADMGDMAEWLEGDVIARHPDLVVWQTGGNDAIPHVSLDRFERETRAGIAALRAAGIKVLLMEPPWSPHLETSADAGLYRIALRRIGADTDVRVVRRWDLMRDWVRRGQASQPEILAADGLHMTDRGSALLARWVASEILAMQACRTGVRLAGS